MRSRTVSAYARVDTRKPLQTKTLTLILTPTNPDRSDTETDTERSVGNTWVWKGVTARSTYLMYAGLGDLVGVSLA